MQIQSESLMNIGKKFLYKFSKATIKMKRIVVIRSSYYSDLEFTMLLKSSRLFSVTDVYSKSHILINSIDSEGYVDVKFKETAVTDVDYFIYLGFPYSESSCQSERNREAMFVENEFYSSLVAILSLMKNKVINYNLYFPLKHIVENKSEQLYLLRSLGWKTPEIFFDYRTPSNECIKLETPDSNNLTRYFLVVSKYRHFVCPYQNVYFDNQKSLDTVIKNTRDFINKNKIGWIVIPFVYADDNFFAFGISDKFPPEVENGFLLDFLEEVIVG